MYYRYSHMANEKHIHELVGLLYIKETYYSTILNGFYLVNFLCNTLLFISCTFYVTIS